MKKVLLSFLLIALTSTMFAQTTPPCATSYVQIGTDPSLCPVNPTGTCTGTNSASVTFTSKIRVFFTTAIPIGVATPTITAGSATGNVNLLNDYRFCISGDQGTAIARTYVDYCVYAKTGPLPVGALTLTFTSGTSSTLPCTVLNSLPCPTAYVCLDNTTGCTKCFTDAGNAYTLTGKIRVFLPAPIPAGVANPLVTAVGGVGVVLNQFKLCAEATAATNVERSFVDYCVYTNVVGTVLPTTGLNLTFAGSATPCVLNLLTLTCPNAFAVLSNTSNCAKCFTDAGNAYTLSNKIRVFFPTPIPANAPNPVINSVLDASLTLLGQFKLCADASAATNVSRTFVDYCVYTNIVGSVLPSTNLTLNIQSSSCAPNQPCLVSSVTPLPCVSDYSVSATTTGAGGAGGTAAGCSNTSNCDGQIVYFASKLRFLFTPCLPAGLPAPTISNYTRTLANGTVIKYCFVVSAASAALVGQQRCTVEYCVYSTLDNDQFFGTPPANLLLDLTFLVTVNGVPNTPLTQSCTSAPSNIPLPLTLLDFAGKLTQQGVKLNWTTTNEISVSHFELMRSDDGANFNVLGRVTATGGGSANTAYSYTDASNLNGRIFYRLNMVDKNGSGKLSQTVVIRINGQNNPIVTVMPNPVHSAMQVKLTDFAAGTYNLELRNSIGQLQYARKVQLNGAEQTETIERTSTMSKGLYMLTVYSSTDNARKTIRIIVD